ncbi:ABC transporter permease [Leucobacter weissii]|uniref:ABC transporter permease n=1 Tax=Leucobacter weissii TaxID=1983706 RepID=A0A939ML60_9MICO|nr:ABC transporter permease [Leucobacter weissii]MBO1902783.1 ABC transporter permease [Leucobacter weissii]
MTDRIRPARRTARGRLRALPFLGPGVLFLTLFMAVPVALLFVYSFFTRGRFGGVQFTFTTENFAKLLDPLYTGVIVQSVGMALIVTLLALLLGYPIAYAITRLPPRWRTVALIAIVLPFWTNFLIRTYAWILLLNNAGIVNQSLQGLGIIDAPLPLLYNGGAVAVGLLYMYLPLMVLPLYASLQAVDPSLREAATNLGSTPWRVFRTVTLPLSLPGALTGAIFVFVPSMSNFVIPELLGGGKMILIGNLIRDQFLEARDWPFGATLALVLTAFLALLIVGQSRVSRRLSGGGRRG